MTARRGKARGGLPRGARPFERRPWGGFQTLEKGPGYQVKRLVVQPGHRFSLQKHRHRAEHWTVVAGTPKVTVGARSRRLRPRESVTVPRGAWRYTRGERSRWERFERPDWSAASPRLRTSKENPVRDVVWTDDAVAELDGEAVAAGALTVRMKTSERRIVDGGLAATPRRPPGSSVWSPRTVWPARGRRPGRRQAPGRRPRSWRRCRRRCVQRAMLCCWSQKVTKSLIELRVKDDDACRQLA